MAKKPFPGRSEVQQRGSSCQMGLYELLPVPHEGVDHAQDDQLHDPDALLPPALRARVDPAEAQQRHDGKV